MNTPNLSYAEYQSILRTDFMSFIELAHSILCPGERFVPSPYLELLASELEKCRLGATKRLLICLPPRSLKSHSTSVCFVAWILAHNPSAKIICASYAQQLAEKLALDTRKLMQSAQYQSLFATRLNPHKSALHDFETTQSGGRRATSVGGALTGLGADFILVDDPTKIEDLFSEVMRNGTNNWFDGTLRSRLNDKVNGCIIVIMQRAHQDDLVGHLLARDPDWKLLSLPAIAECDEHYLIQTPYGTKTFSRKEGEALHPEREPLSSLLKTREQTGSYYFSSQYQQNPTPVEGAMIKADWLMRFDLAAPPPPGYSQILQSWDTAHKSGELNDYSVCTTWRIVGDHYYLLHVLRQKLEYPQLKQKIISMAQEYKPKEVVIEDKSSGIALIQDLSELRRFKLVPYTPPAGTDKTMRLFTQTDLFENGRILLPTQAPWLAEYEKELLSFPGSKFDDQVDSTTQALAHIREGSKTLRTWQALGR
ncbi:phage terminase large subunit [Polynucleobacter sp. 78F-HAINBA]|uniref:phage terminase large subunit n=1 Tax=Polynucleobacter sp. 78F-HAINBA TaxID=2689099 RepID=UPI001C0E2937|nr:phage terminase large subunit [Polynucleobacter sp. 78F-HAINBA]MBU3591194.1 phage terminase large subunit [Polynucleobacter sp. 78F-HAINBA]